MVVEALKLQRTQTCHFYTLLPARRPPQQWPEKCGDMRRCLKTCKTMAVAEGPIGQRAWRFGNAIRRTEYLLRSWFLLAPQSSPIAIGAEEKQETRDDSQNLACHCDFGWRAV